MSADTELSDIEYSDDDYDYYGGDCDVEAIDPAKFDPEYFPFICRNVQEVEKLLNEAVELLSNSLKVTPFLAKPRNKSKLKHGQKLLHHETALTQNTWIEIEPPCISNEVMLHAYNWNTQEIILRYKQNSDEVLVFSKVKPPAIVQSNITCKELCIVCASPSDESRSSALSCSHFFCNNCWTAHFEVQITQGISIGISCMAQECEVRAPEDFVLAHLSKPQLRERYQHFNFMDHVKSHPELRFCPGPNCELVIHAAGSHGTRVQCSGCATLTCFCCGAAHHAPTDCATIRLWLTKCADDSETANYISAHTKDCPKCQICIEKNGGCNHMQCGACRHDFCWVCLGEWRNHGSEYYECSRYKEDPNAVKDTQHAQAREALKKYLHYYERWENHARSLKLEEHTLDNLKCRINQKVMAGEGTWIDWQHLWAGASLLAKCRYTLQYTYPYAYYMDNGPDKELFEYQQAQLEAEIENLSWKIERAETTDKGELQNQMNIAERRRVTLLTKFLEQTSIKQIRS